jgi:hypothetical protein
LVEGMLKSGAGLPTLANVTAFSVAVPVAVDIIFIYLLFDFSPQSTQRSLS